MTSKSEWPKAVFYDSKNTLFDWSKLWVEASSNILKHYGCNNVDGRQFKTLWHHLLVSENHRTAFAKYREFTESLKDSLDYAMKYHNVPGKPDDVKYMLELWDAVMPFSDTVPALKNQQQLTKVLIFSNVETEYLKMMADKMVGFKPDFMGSMQQAGTCKPSPRAYNWVLEKNDLKIEDVIYCAGPQWDAQGAYALGMKTIWLNRSGESLNGVAVDHEVKDLHGVTEIVKQHR